ncbi:hypothetical protein AB0T13_23295, partial [Escherichia coli]
GQLRNVGVPWLVGAMAVVYVGVFLLGKALALPAEPFRGLTLSGTKTHVKQRFLPLTPLLMVSDVLWSPVLPA